MTSKVASDEASTVAISDLRGTLRHRMRGYVASSLAATLAIAVLAASHNLATAPKHDDYSRYVRDLDRSAGDVPDDTVVLQFAHAAPNVSRLDVYVTTAEKAVVLSRYIATLSLAEASVPFELPLAASNDAPLRSRVVIELRATDTDRTLYKSDAIDVTERSRVLFAIVGTDDRRKTPVELVSVGGAARLSVQR